MKVLSTLKPEKRCHPDCQIVKRRGHLYAPYNGDSGFKEKQGNRKLTRTSSHQSDNKQLRTKKIESTQLSKISESTSSRLPDSQASRSSLCDLQKQPSFQGKTGQHKKRIINQSTGVPTTLVTTHSVREQITLTSSANKQHFVLANIRQG